MKTFRDKAAKYDSRGNSYHNSEISENCFPYQELRTKSSTSSWLFSKWKVNYLFLPVSVVSYYVSQQGSKDFPFYFYLLVLLFVFTSTA